MGSHLNYQNIGDISLGEGSNGKPPGTFPLVREPSLLYSLTFDELQNTFSGLGKDFGSMNMDELLKSIWTAEGTQPTTASGVEPQGNGHGHVGNLQRQGSLTLPRTLSQKTVDEVWKDLMKETSGDKDVNVGGGSNMPQGHHTLGEVTLEDFLARAGVVREDAQQTGRPDENNGYYAELQIPNTSAGFTLGFQQPNQNNGLIVSSQMMDNNNSVHHQSPRLALNVGGVISSHQQAQQPQMQHRQLIQPLQQQQLNHQLPMQQQLTLFPKQSNVPFGAPINFANSAQLDKPAVKTSPVGTAVHTMNNKVAPMNGLQNGGMNLVPLGTRGVTMASGSPVNQLSPDVIAKGSIDTLSPVPYVFSRGRKPNSALEKVVERRQKRMIKNRESAARSRARKQAYTLELEAEVAKLKEMNEELQRKQEEIMEMQQNQTLETDCRSWGLKRRCLRRTVTGPW